MKPLQVYLAEDESRRLDRWAKQRGWTKSQAVRAAIRALTSDRDEDPLLSMSGMVQEVLPEDCAEHFDRYVQETYVAEEKAEYRKRKRVGKSRIRG